MLFRNHITSFLRLALSRKGFTLVELIVAIGVLGILTGAITITVDGVNEDTRLSNAVTRALADLRYAHEMAMTHRRAVEVTILPGADRYEIRWQGGAYLPSPVDKEDLIVEFNSGDYQGVDIVSSGFGGALVFDHLGNPLDGSASLGAVKSAMHLNSTYHVVVYPSGYISMEQSIGSGSGCGGGC